jgi:hypothetical protein
MATRRGVTAVEPMRRAAVVQPAAEAPDGTKIPRIKVSVNWSEQEGVALKCSHPPGATRSIINHFASVRTRKTINDYVAYYTDDLKNTIYGLRSQISAEEWAHAIAAEIFGRMSIAREASVELSNVAKGGYLALSDGVYHLTPVSSAPLSKAMAVIRRRALEGAKGEAKAILDSAHAQEESLLERASQKLSDAMRKEEQVKERLGQAPPLWLLQSGRPCRKRSSWEAGFIVHIILTGFEYLWEAADPANGETILKRKFWKALPQPPVSTLLWVPLRENGSYNERSVHVDSSCFQLPHMGWEASCMSLMQAPPQIASEMHLNALANAVSNCMQTANLSSLYGEARNWHKSLKDAVPESIRQYMFQPANAGITMLAQPAVACDQETSVPASVERAQTWAVQGGMATTP